MFKTNSIPKTLVPVDFSKGIRSDAIMQNFNVLSGMLMRERLSVSGHGISSGLSININDFNITVTEGALIDFKGNEVFLEEESFKIPLPRLSYVKDEVYTVGDNGIIILPHVPYHTNRSHIVNGREQNTGLVVSDYNNAMNKYNVESTDGNIIVINQNLTGKLVKISYAYTNKRYDTVYIDTDHKIKVAEGTTSSSPSVLIPEESTYILSFIEVDPYMPDDVHRKKAGLKIKEDLRGRRNLYTDNENRLYICGVPFDDLQIIHMSMPLNPFENQLWYDIDHNKLKVWKTIDGIASWVNVNDTSVIPVLEQKLWTPEENPADRKRFLFHNEKDHNMKYIPKKNELQLYIDQGVIHNDQFFEITLEDAKEDQALRNELINDFGYEEESIMNIDGSYENYGIGFELYYPLENPSYVEARTTHRVNENPLATRFQRSATFVAEGLTTVRDSGKEFETYEPYRCGENQLEVFMDGKKLINGVQFKEGADIKTPQGQYVTDIKKGTVSHRYRILIDVPDNTFIHYRITTNVYSYDHIDGMLGGLSEALSKVEIDSKESIDEMHMIKDQVGEAMNVMLEDIEALKRDNGSGSSDNFYEKGEIIPESAIHYSVLNRTIDSTINTVLEKNGQFLPIDRIYENDYIVAHAISGSKQRILVRGTLDSPYDYDYRVSMSDSGQTGLVFTDKDPIDDGTKIYITGFRFVSIPY